MHIGAEPHGYPLPKASIRYITEPLDTDPQFDPAYGCTEGVVGTGDTINE